MKKLISAIIVLSLTLSLIPAYADADNSETVNNTVSGYVSVTGGDILIASDEKTPRIYVDKNDFAGVTRAVGDLQSDIKAVTDVTANITDNAENADIIIGTMGKSNAIDALIAENKLDVSEIENQWEAFTLQNIDGTLVIAGADKRGTIYGIYDLSEKMGVSPWEWWADVIPVHSDKIYITLPQNGYTEGASSVKYRGVFLNQEYNLWNWAKSLDGDIGINTETYKKVFELLLRLKANYLWPAMHEYTQAFNVNPENARLADEYGIVMGTSHCEMLLRNNMGELLEFQERWVKENPDKNLYMFKDGSLNADVAYDYTDVDKDGNPVSNKEFIEDYWRERIRANKDYESNFTIGMRGVHDGAWNPVNAKTDAKKIALLEEIIAKQREILSEEIGKRANEIPQTFIPYKEILPLYNAGLNIPDDVTIMWTNDNYGHIRQSSNASERERSGGGGMYYHVSYFGRPSSVIWNGGSQLGLIKEEMTKAYDCGADTVWVLNVGPLKGFENQTEYFLDLGRSLDNMRNTSVKDYVQDNAKRYFNFDNDKAKEYADIQCEFLEIANARRPDFMTQNVYSVTSGEGDDVLDKYDSLLKRSEALYNLLPADKQPSFYELQLYAVRSANNIANTFINADKASLYKSQGRGASVNKYSEKSKLAWAKITEDTNEYNTMLQNKWKNAVNPFQKKESGSWDIMRNWKSDVVPATLETVDTLPFTEMGIAVENQKDINISPTLEFSGYSKDIRFIDIFNRGTGSFDWKITSDADWIIFNKTNGTVYDDDHIYAGVDWDRVPVGDSTAKITVTRYIGENAVQSKSINVKVNNDIKSLPEKTYAEANGYVSIETEHFTRSVQNGSYKWTEQDDFGRNGTSMKFMPDTADSITDNDAYLEYDVNFESTGTFDVDIYRMPTLNERGSVNFALGIDEAEPAILKGNNTYYNNSSGTDKWGKSILNNIEVLTTTVSVCEKGIHKIRLYGIDTGAVIDKIVITTGEKQESFYGESESYNTTYNNGSHITAGVVTGDTPKLITDKNNGIGIITVYKNNGALSSIQTSENYADGAFVFDKAINLANGETVKGMVWSSLEEMKPLSGVYGIAGTGGNANDMPLPSKPSTEIKGEITALFEPKLYVSEINTTDNAVTDVSVIKLADISNATVTIAAYNADGAELSENTIMHDFSAAEINEKISVPIAFDIPAAAAELQTIIYDNKENLNALAPSYTTDIDGISPTASYDSGVIQIKSSLDNFTGKEAICRISDASTDETVYIRQETVKDSTFKTVKTGDLDGIYNVDVGVSGNGKVVSEKAYTAKNITPDNNETSTELYNWDFASDTTVSSGNNVPVISGNAAYDEVNQTVKMTSTDKSGGKLGINFDKPITSAQGQTITVVSKIAYGRQDGKYMDYVITDSSGKELIKSHISIYSSKGAIEIGGEQVFDGIPDGIKTSKKNNDGVQNGYSTYTTLLNPDTKTITLTISNADGESVFTGKFPDASSLDVGALNFSTTVSYKGRSCYADDISVSKTTAPSYTMVFDIKDSAGNKIENAAVNLTDGKFGIAIDAKNDGTYHLCDGVYSYTITADGYEAVNGELELSQATESKTISVILTKSSEPTPTITPTATPTVTPTASPDPTDEPTTKPTAEPIEYDNTAGHWKFDFGADTENGYIGVNSGTNYSDELTYGFIGTKEDDYKLTLQEHIDGFRMVQGQKITLSDGDGTADAPNNDFVAVTDAQYPIRFAMNVENGGYYNIKVALANASQTEPATVSLFTERRHQLLTNTEIPAGGILEYEFNVDVETYYWKALNGQYKDDTISVEVAGENASIASMEVTKTTGKTIWVLSDSTGCDQPTNFPYFNLASLAGVGQGLTKYLPDDIAMSNQGDGGIASNDTSHYACAKSAFKEGDYLYVEYGHNDTSTDGYKTNLERYYTDCRNAGVKMIVVGPIDRCQPKQFDTTTGKWSSTLGGYSTAGKEFVDAKIASGATDIAFVDLNAGWIEFLNNTTERVKDIRQNNTYESDSVYYYYRYKSSGIDTTHINEAGADNAAYIFFTEAKKIVDANADAQAAVLADLVNGMREQTPYTVTEEIVRAGKVPNSYYPEIPAEEYEGYEAKIKNVSLDGGLLQSVTAKIEHYTGLDKKDIPYAVAIAEIYNADGSLADTYQSTTATKYDTTNGNGTFTLVFDNAVLPDDGTYKIWLQGFTSDNQVMDGEDNRISDYYTPDSGYDNYLIGDKEDIEIPDTFAYYGIKTGSDLSGNNGWYLVGSSSRSATLEKENRTGYAKLTKTLDKEGSYVVFRAFDSAVNSSKLILDTDLYYEEGYMKFVLSNKTNTPNSGYKQRIDCLTIDNGKLLDGNGTEIGTFPSNEWVHITYTLDMDYGTQTLTVGEESYEYSADGLKAILSEEVSPSSVQQLNISGSSKNTLSARIKNIFVKNTVQTELPERTLTITEPENAEGTISVADSEELIKTAKMNSLITVSAIPADGYIFDGWYENDEKLSGAAKLTARLHRDITLTPKFTENINPNETRWTFSAYGENPVNGTSVTGNQTTENVDYNGLKIHLNNGDSITANGVVWTAPGRTASDDVPVSNNRYIKYTPDKNGTLSVTFNSSYTASKANNNPRMYIISGTDESCMSKKNSDSGAQATTVGANKDTTVTAEVTAGTTYYIWPYCYNKATAPFNITSVTFNAAE